MSAAAGKIDPTAFAEVIQELSEGESDTEEQPLEKPQTNGNDGDDTMTPYEKLRCQQGQPTVFCAQTQRRVFLLPGARPKTQAAGMKLVPTGKVIRSALFNKRLGLQGQPTPGAEVTLQS